MGQWVGRKSRPGPPWAAGPGLVLHGHVDQGGWQSRGLGGHHQQSCVSGQGPWQMGGATSAMGMWVWGDICSRHVGPAGPVRAQ